MIVISKEIAMKSKKIILVCGVLCFPFVGEVAPGYLEVAENVCSLEGEEKLEDSLFDEAKSLFDGARRKAIESGNQKQAETCFFYLGLASQLKASAVSSEDRNELLAEAAAWYERIPGSNRTTGLVGNLARVYIGLGNKQDAVKLFNKEIGNAGGNAKFVLMRSYADLLGSQSQVEDWKNAAELYREILRAFPADEATWNAFLSMISKRIPPELPDAVWEAVEAKQIVVAQRHALQALQASGDFDNAGKISLLAAFVAAIARQEYSPESFMHSESAEGLHKLVADPVVGTGARLVLALYGRKPLSAKDVQWWAKDGKSDGRSPLSAFRLICRSLAESVQGEDLSNTYEYLELADNLTEVPDLALYTELATAYAADQKTASLSRVLTKWENSIHGLEAKSNEEDQKRLAEFRVTMGRLLADQGTRAKPGEVDSIEYQLERARVAASRSKDKETFTIVEEAQRRLLPGPNGGGGGGYGGGGGVWGRRAWDDAIGACIEGIGGCSSFQVEVPDLFQKPEDVLAGVTRWITLTRGCDGSRVTGWRFSRTSPEDQIRLASFSRREARPSISEIETCSEAVLPCRTNLIPRPAWVTTGAWSGTTSVLVVDAIRNLFLRYGTDGQLLEVKEKFSTHTSPDQDTQPLRVRAAPSGFPVLQLGVGTLLWLDNNANPVREVELIGRRGAQGILRSIFDWTVVNDDMILAIGGILHPNGTWTTGLVQVPVGNSKKFEVIKEWPAYDPTDILYRMGQPYLASVDGKGYFLQIGERLSLYEVLMFAKSSTLRLITNVPGSVMLSAREKLLSLQTPEESVALHRLVDRLDIPAGMYAADGFIFLLKHRTDIGTGDTSWWFEKIDPRQGHFLESVALPSSAHQLMVIPGASQWAIIEKGPVSGLGQQEISSIVFVPSSMFKKGDG